jgi:hypothetical protein
METMDETALRNQAPLPNQRDCGGRLEARPISQPRCQRTVAEGIRSISLVRSAGVFTTSLSTPGVFLPSLSCDTRRMLIRVFALLLSISFCRDLAFLGFPSLVALKMRCRKLRIDVSTCRQLTQFQSTDSEVTFVMLLLNIQFIPADFALTLHFSANSPDSRQPPFGAGYRPLSGRL